MAERCDKCRFWVELINDRGTGRCRRYPHWDTHLADDWCGEWQEKKAAVNPLPYPVNCDYSHEVEDCVGSFVRDGWSVEVVRDNLAGSDARWVVTPFSVE